MTNKIKRERFAIESNGGQNTGSTGLTCFATQRDGIASSPACSMRYHPWNPMTDIAAIQSAVVAQSGWLREALRSLVLVESPSDSKPAVDRCMALAESLAAAPVAGSRANGSPGVRARRYKQKHFGDVLELRFGQARSKRKPILLLGHLDTVWPLGTLAAMPFHEADGRICGPGVLDMKAGVAMALTALRALHQVGVARPVTLLLNSEEEVGSPVSRAITERLALASHAVLVLEPAQGLACKTSRKGVGDYRLEVTGVASHSGVDFERGHSAILELARLLATVATFTDLRIGRTVNPGVVAGGTRSNVVAAHAFAEVDVRIARGSDAPRVDRLFRSLKCADPACTLTVSGGLNRPPMERKPGTVALYKQARSLAAQLGFTLDEAATGGGSDGNFTAALGVPTLDGLGAVGEGAHASHESIFTEHLIPRTALLAALIATLD
jgi:glutamate carboxypeptidase